MATQYTDLELAINTLVTNFHSASSSNADTLSAQEFQNMLSQEMPDMVKIAEEFFRITNKDLLDVFRAAMDRFTPKLLKVYRARKTAFGEDMEQLLERLDERPEGDQGGLNKLLKDIGVEEGKNVTFNNFWGLVNSLATSQFGLQSKEKQVKCVKCILL